MLVTYAKTIAENKKFLIDMEKNPLYICRANLDKNIHFLDYLLSDGQSLEYNTNKALRTMHAQY